MLSICVIPPKQAHAFWPAVVTWATGQFADKATDTAVNWVDQYKDVKDIKELSNESKEDLEAMAENQETIEENQNIIIKELKEAFNRPDDVYKLATNDTFRAKYFRKRYLKLNSGEKTALAFKMHDYYTATGSLNPDSVLEFYNLMTLIEEEALIIDLKKRGFSDEEAALRVKKYRESVALKKATLVKDRERKIELENELELLAVELEAIETQMENTSDDSEKSKLFDKRTDIVEKRSALNTSLSIIDSNIESNVSSLETSQLAFYNELAREREDSLAIKEYEDYLKNWEAHKTERANNHIKLARLARGYSEGYLK